MLINHNSDRVIFTFANLVFTGGFADGEYLTITPIDAERYKTYVSTDGTYTRSKSNNKGFRIAVQFVQASDSNLTLVELYDNDDRSVNGVTGALSVKNLNTGKQFRAARAWIVGIPEEIYGREPTVRTWLFDTDEGIEERLPA